MTQGEYRIFTPSGDRWMQRPATDLQVISTTAVVNTSNAARPLPVAQPFDVTEIPDAMEKMGWHVAAALLNKWFHYAPKNQASSSFEKANGYSDLHAYPADRIDRTTIKLDWILSFERAANGFKELQNPFYLSNSRAREALVRKLYGYKGEYPQVVNTLALCDYDIHRVHHRFQFQMFRVDTTTLEKCETFFRAELRHGKPDDLAGALGGFAFYAAVAEAEVKRLWGGDTEITVNRIALYMKNPYSFFDDPDNGGSQYLGHWNRSGIALVPFGFIAQKENFGSWSQYPVQPEGPYGRTFWPVRNSDFRRWQDQHNAGGDMILYSDYRVVDVKPIKIRI